MYRANASGSCGLTEEQTSRICSVEALQSIRMLSISGAFPHPKTIRLLLSRSAHLTELHYETRLQLEDAMFEQASGSLRQVGIRSMSVLAASSWMVLGSRLMLQDDQRRE
jgi:hypothetical protein